MRECCRLGELGSDSEGDAKSDRRTAGLAGRVALCVERVSTAELHLVARWRHRQHDLSTNPGRR